MSSINQHHRSKQIWVVVILALILSFCVGMLVWLAWSEPADASVSEEISSSSQASSSKKAVLSSSSKSSSKSESNEALSSSRPAQTKTTRHVGTIATNTAISKLQNMEVNAGVVHDENGTYNNIFINADGVTLKNKVVLGDFVISESVKNGTVTLENIVVKGRILVNGAQTVNLKDVTAVQVIAQRSSGTTDYLISGASTIHQFTAKNQLTIDQSGISSNYAGVKKLSTERGTPMWQQVTLKKGTIEQVTTNEATNLMLESGSSVGEVIANASTHIGGNGRVNKLIVRSDEVSYENKPRDVDIEGDYNQPNEQNWAIGQSELSQNGGSHSGSSSKTLSTPNNLAITAAEVANSVTLTFNSVSNATGYTVIYSITNGSSALNVTNQTVTTTTNGCTLTHSLIGQEGTVISFRVRATSTSSTYNMSAYSCEYSKTVVTLGAPTNVSLSLDESNLKLSFTTASNASAYSHEVILSVAGYDDVITTLAAGITSAEFSNHVYGQTYTVAVRAVGDSKLALSSSTATATCDVPALPVASDVSISNDGSYLMVSFTGASGVSEYTVTLRYDGATLSSTGNSESGDVYTYLFNPPASITAGKQYTASVIPKGGAEATASKTVHQRSAPTNLSITSNAIDSVSFNFDKDSEMSYEVVAKQNGTSLGGVTESNLTATGLTINNGDEFNFSVKTLGDDIFYTDSETESASEVTASQLNASTNLSVVDLDSGASARFQFDEVSGVTSYTISYTLSNDATGSIDEKNYATAIATPVSLSGTTVKSFTVTAHKDADSTHIYLDSVASYTVP